MCNVIRHIKTVTIYAQVSHREKTWFCPSPFQTVCTISEIKLISDYALKKPLENKWLTEFQYVWDHGFKINYEIKTQSPESSDAQSSAPLRNMPDPCQNISILVSLTNSKEVILREVI